MAKIRVERRNRKSTRNGKKRRCLMFDSKILYLVSIPYHLYTIIFFTPSSPLSLPPSPTIPTTFYSTLLNAHSLTPLGLPNLSPHSSISRLSESSLNLMLLLSLLRIMYEIQGSRNVWRWSRKKQSYFLLED